MLGDKFANPVFLWLLLLIPAIGYYLWRRGEKMKVVLQFSSMFIFKKIPKTFRERLVHLPLSLRLLAVAFFIVALARPQSISDKQNISTEGIDIVLELDISGSMLAEDFNPNRIEAAKQVASEFIDGRSNDRIGLVVFSAESFTQCPLTTDYAVLKNLLGEVKNGVNNRGEIDPITAARIAATYNIRIYTVGVGARGEAPYPMPTPLGIRRQMIPVDLDEKGLTQVAEMTGGKYFRATDNRKLKAIYKEIDQLERTKIEITAYKKYSELYPDWLLLGIIAVALEIGLSTTVLRRNP
jgi:Ca-activated chloride channel family protein